MKVLLVQLPVPDNRFSNLPLALGYLKAMAETAGIAGLQVELLEPEIQNRGGDALLVDAILAHSPDLVGFSLYTWNSSRTLRLARRLKALAPELLLLAGGPEVNYDGDFVLASPDLDFLALGEGEQTFVELLHLLNRGRHPSIEDLQIIKGLAFRSQLSAISYQLSALNLSTQHSALSTQHSSFPWHFTPPRSALPDVNLVPSAYLSGALESHLGKSMSIELSRWCPSKCTFCYYGRQDLPRGGKRYFELERIRQELFFGMEHGVEQIHFVEANFNTLPHLPLLYETIKATGANRRMSFYAELRGEAIDLAEAARLAECNFSTVEVGLQSAVPEVLARVRRKNHLPRLAQGVHNLRAQGIEVFLDVILGLPGETAETFQRSLAFIEENDLAPYDLFHLQILSGTQLKAEVSAGQHGIRAQAAPPYFVLETATLSFESLRDLRYQTLLRKGEDPTAIAGLPQPGAFALAQTAKHAADINAKSSPIERVILDFADDLNQSTIYNLQWPRATLSTITRRLGSQLTIWLKLGQAAEEVMTRAVAALQLLSKPNPGGFWHLFVQAERPLSEAERKRLYQAIYHEEDYLDRLAVFASASKLPWSSVNLFQVLPYGEIVDQAVSPETIWRVVLDEGDTAAGWRSQIGEALTSAGVGLLVETPSGCSPAKLRAALDGLDLAGKHLWLTDGDLAAGLAYAAAEDSLEAVAILDYPLTAVLQGEQIRFERPSKVSLERDALRWASSNRALSL